MWPSEGSYISGGWRACLISGPVAQSASSPCPQARIRSAPNQASADWLGEEQLMPFRFRKTVKLGKGLRLNLSKGGAPGRWPSDRMRL